MGAEGMAAILVALTEYTIINEETSRPRRLNEVLALLKVIIFSL